MATVNLFDARKQDVQALMKEFPKELLHFHGKKGWSKRFKSIVTTKSTRFERGQAPKNKLAREYEKSHQFSIIPHFVSYVVQCFFDRLGMFDDEMKTLQHFLTGQRLTAEPVGYADQHTVQCQ